MMVIHAGCGRRTNPQRQRPLVVTSFYPVFDLTRAVAGDDFELICLTPPGGDPHNVDPAPEMVRQMTDASGIIVLGLGMDAWVERLAPAEKKQAIVRLGDGLNTRKIGAGLLAGETGETHDPDEADPHVWLDPTLAMKMAERACDGLMQLRPEFREALIVRRDILLKQLAILDQEFKVMSAKLAERKVVTFHGAFGYLFDRYDLEVIGTIEPFPGQEPSAKYLRALVEAIRSFDVKVVFSEPQLPDRLAKVIAEEVHAKVARLDPCETILIENPQATYLERQRMNLQTLREHLGNSKSP